MDKFCQILTIICLQHFLFLFPDDNLSKYQWVLPNLVCALILGRSGLGLLMGDFFQCLAELSAPDMSDFLFLDDINGFSPNLVCALILYRYGLGL